jgi:hypothetical protein
VRCTAVSLFIMFCEYMFRCYLFPFILLFSTSSIFELHVIVAGIIMFNILELIIEIVSNYPTEATWQMPSVASWKTRWGLKSACLVCVRSRSTEITLIGKAERELVPEMSWLTAALLAEHMAMWMSISQSSTHIHLHMPHVRRHHVYLKRRSKLVL